MEENMDSTRKRHRAVSRTRQRTPVQRGRNARKGKQVEDERAKSPDAEAIEKVYGEMKGVLKERVVCELRRTMTVFEGLAAEGEAVGCQLTRGSDTGQLDTNLDVEVDDDL
jgi:hypothetical protein